MSGHHDDIPPATQESKGSQAPHATQESQANVLMLLDQPIEEDIAQAGEEMTQADDIPPFTQESQLVYTEKRAIESYFIATNPFKPPRPVGKNQSSRSSFPTRFGPNIRAPAPMTFHPNEIMNPSRGSGPSAPVPVIKIGGKKYVTMANLEASMVEGSKKKNKKKPGKK
ncbi:hypothetical protein OROMI_008305 [Orobanche minor]